jgi:hypothetical protein
VQNNAVLPNDDFVATHKYVIRRVSSSKRNLATANRNVKGRRGGGLACHPVKPYHECILNRWIARTGRHTVNMLLNHGIKFVIAQIRESL